MTWAWFTEKDWQNLFALCREDGMDRLGMDDIDIRACAESYMAHGADGGGNTWGAYGTVVAFNCDRLSRARWNR